VEKIILSCLKIDSWTKIGKSPIYSLRSSKESEQFLEDQIEEENEAFGFDGESNESDDLETILAKAPDVLRSYVTELQEENASLKTENERFKNTYEPESHWPKLPVSAEGALPAYNPNYVPTAPKYNF
jgi:hypothetical protein